MTAKNSIPLQVQSYYFSLSDSYTKSILNSGLLLDEDIEVLLSLLNPNPTSHYQYKLSQKLAASILSLLGSVVLAKKVDSKLVLVPSLLITILSTTLEILDVRRRKYEEGIVNDLIDVLKKIHKVNRQVILYTNARNELKPDELLVHHKKIEEFFRTFSENQQTYSQIFSDALLKIGCTTDVLSDDLDCLRSIDFSDSLSLKEYNIEACFTYSKKVQDFQIWLTSKLLSYIGIVFNSVGEKVMKLLLNTTIPQLLNSLRSYYVESKRQFNHVRESVRNWTEYKTQREGKSKKVISAKLENAIASVVDNLSLVSEKSCGLLNQIDNTLTNAEELNKSLLDLRNHTYATYESLDLLCKLYGNLSNVKQVATNIETSSKPIQQPDSTDGVLLVRYDDQKEPLEEQFDLYIEKDDAEGVDEPSRYSEDSSGAYVGLLLQELSQSLKQHERFVQAKKRRGSVEEKVNVAAEEVVPAFDLRVLRSDTSKSKIRLETTKDDEAIERILPPPLPPPLPLKSIDLFQIEESGYAVQQKSMIEGIRALSGQLSGKEEVFGSQ